MNDLDQAARYAARRLDVPGFLRWLLGEKTWAHWRWTRWLDTQSVPFPGEPDRRADLVAEFERPAGDAPPMAVVVEFMSEARGLTPERLAEYALRLRREQPYQTDPLVRYDVIGVLVNLTGQAGLARWKMAPRDCGGLGLWTKARVRNLSRVSARTTLASVASGSTSRCLLAWVPLMRGAGKADVVTEWRRLAEQEPNARLRGDYAGLALLFAELAERRGVWEKGLEGWNVQRSKIALEWETRGQVKALRADMLRVLRFRFGEPPTDVVATLEAQEDPVKLDAWFDGALAAGTLDEVRRLLGVAAG